MAKYKLGIIVGSNRRDSINRKLAQALTKLGGDAFEPAFIQIDDLPMYNQDNEQPVPAPVARLKAELRGTAVAQQHLRAVLGDLGLHVAGGEAYVAFKPDLIDAQSAVSDEGVRKFLKSYIDQFAGFAGKFATQSARQAA